MWQNSFVSSMKSYMPMHNYHAQPCHVRCSLLALLYITQDAEQLSAAHTPSTTCQSACFSNSKDFNNLTTYMV